MPGKTPFDQAALIAQANLKDPSQDTEKYQSPEKTSGTPRGLSGIKRLPSLSPSENDSLDAMPTSMSVDEQMTLCQQLLKDYGGLECLTNDSPIIKKHSQAVKQSSRRFKTSEETKADDMISQLNEFLRISNETQE